MTQTEAGAPAGSPSAPWLGMRSGHFCFVTDWGHKGKKSSGFVQTEDSIVVEADLGGEPVAQSRS